MVILMSLFGFMFGCSKGPYKNDGINTIYNLLFCDNQELFLNKCQEPEKYPWDIVLSKKSSDDDLRKIINDKNLESRVKILAYNELRNRKVAISNKELLGIIIEIGFDNGLDVLAAYKDGTARYINQSGKLIVWDVNDNKSDTIIKELFLHGENVINNIGPWDKPRLPYPEKGMARMTFLVSDGLYFGQGPTGVLFEDKMGRPVLDAGTKLMQYLIEKASK